MSEVTEADIHQMREQGDLGPFLRQQQALGHQRAAANLAAVRRHPDLMQQVADLGLRTWTGRVPPARDATGAINNSPLAARLTAIVTEAQRRTTETERKAA
ncbi:hypothetical protein [Streptomyces sp. SCSIO ZS0520]|uniref:hypothetical protein n=1 Tax=Streptomyces sp. SCSIO ZS0520 TaxID=2892996 RepID=UPI0021D84EA0|nr:hypothetical protein [Streptomyces sp. SCSIO ZS0520]